MVWLDKADRKATVTQIINFLPPRSVEEIQCTHDHIKLKNAIILVS